MSLDVYLLEVNEPVYTEGGIYIREDGATKCISREEWNERFPDREPIVIGPQETVYAYTANITHNLASMAVHAHLYEPLWRPDEHGYEKAFQLIQPLEEGLELLRARPDFFKTFNPTNGWGDYDLLVDFTEQYLKACKRYPEAKISVWR